MRSRLLALAPIFLLVLATLSGQAAQAPLPSPIAAGFTAIPTPAADGAAEPNLTTDRRGRVWLTWLEPRPGGGHRFRLATISGAAGKWSAPVTIAEGASFLANWADFPSLFVAADGTMAAHWLERGAGKPYGIRISTSRDNGRTWTPAVSPHRDSVVGEYGFVSFYEAPGGGVGMVWLDGRGSAGHAAAGHGGGMALRSTTIKNGVPGDEIVLDAKVCDCCQTSAARTTDGVLVAYRDRSDKEIRDTSIVKFAGGKWSSPVTVHNDNWEINGCPVNGPVVTASGNSAAVAWFTAVGDAPKTLVAFSQDAGKTFGAPIPVHAGTTLGRIGMVMPSPDRVLVSSLERANPGARLVLRDVRRDGRTSAPVEIAPATPDRSGGFARLANAGSKLVVAWTEVRPGVPTTIRTATAEVR
jgi:hypothetical protein